MLWSRFRLWWKTRRTKLEKLERRIQELEHDNRVLRDKLQDYRQECLRHRHKH